MKITKFENTDLNHFKRMVKNTKRFNSGYVKTKTSENCVTFYKKTTNQPLRDISFHNGTIEVIDF